MRISGLNETDTAAIIELEEKCFGHTYDLPPLTPAQIREILSNGFIYGIRNGKQLASVIDIEFRKPEWYVNGIYTHPDHQHQGLAQQLLARVILEARKKKVPKITATVHPHNATSIRLFEKNGFLKTRFIPDCYGPGKDRFVLELRLQRKTPVQKPAAKKRKRLK
ncbi:MAG: GNAT family N-acetyltransferase [Candidatus Diapherotrites archaeon]|nr:GNAT family N-acetyltransferase [Candidatus Diapherotrites archaeon]